MAVGGGRKRSINLGGASVTLGGLPTVPESVPLKAVTASRNSNASEMTSEAEPDGSTADLLKAVDGGGGGTRDSTTSSPMPPLRPQRQTTPPKPTIVGYEVAPDTDADSEASSAVASMVREFPQRAGKQPCDFYVKTGHCKFGDTCVNDHPPQYAVPLTVAMGLPLRPDQPICTFYIKHNQCKFGPVCRFHHPPLVPIYAGSLAAAAMEGEGGVEADTAAD